MDSGSLMMSEIVDIPDDSSPSEDSCLMEIGLRSQRERGNRTASEGADGMDGGEYSCFRYPPTQTPESPLAGGPRAKRFLRGERSNSCSSPSTGTSTYRWRHTFIHSQHLYSRIWSEHRQKYESRNSFKAEMLWSEPTGPRCCIARPCWPAAAPSWKP